MLSGSFLLNMQLKAKYDATSIFERVYEQYKERHGL